MKKFQIFTLCAALILGCVLLTNAKDLTKPKDLVAEEHGTSISGMISGANATEVMTGAYRTGDATTGGAICDLNEDREINVADVNRFYTNCSVTNGRNSKCDLNRDNEFSVADINHFNYKCLNEILKGHDKCDYDADGKVTIADMTSLIDVCTKAILEGNTNLLSVCDFNSDGKLNISDITEIQSVCSDKILGKETGSGANNTGGNLQNNNICDLNEDREINIADVNRFYTNCSVTNGRNSKCDLNRDNEFSVADINHFNYKCLNEILKGHDKCDYDADGKVTNSDMTSLMDLCTNAILEGNTNLLSVCDFNSDGKLNISDITEIQSVCSKKISGTEAGSGANNTGGNLPTNTQYSGYAICDFNNDGEVSIADRNAFNSTCFSNNGRNPKCDLNTDGEVNIADMNVFNDCFNEEVFGTNSGNDGGNVNTGNGTNFNGGNSYSVYTEEMVSAYEFAYKNGITNKNTIQEASMNGELTRKAMAKMLSQYAINVLGLEPDSSKGKQTFKDITNKMDEEYYITLSYQLGIMGQNMKDGYFKPNDKVTTAQLGTALSRLLYGDKYNVEGSKYYKKHLDALKDKGIINKISNPTTNIVKRRYLFAMLERAAKQ